MGIRDEVLGKQGGLLKVFLRPEEIALIGCALTWVKADLVSADKEAGELGKKLREQVPAGVFKHWLPVIDWTQKSLIEQSIADCDERKDQEGKKRWKQALTDMTDDLLTTQQFRHLVLATFYASGSVASGPTERKK